MTRTVIDALLAIIVLSSWLAAAGFARLRDPLDRLHCVPFVYATAGVALVILAFTADGASVRALKTLLIVCLGLVSGAAMSHVTGRALTLRSRDDASR